MVKAAGIDPVYFGVLFMINNAIGLITPPVGTVLSTVAGVGKVSMDEVTKGVWPFMVAQFVGHVPDGFLPAAGAWCRRTGSTADAQAFTRRPARHARDMFASKTDRSPPWRCSSAVARAWRSAAQAQTTTIKFATQNPKGHPIVMGMEKFARAGGGQVRRQAEGQVYPRRRAGQRPGQRVGAAGRHARDGGDELRHLRQPGQGVRDLRLPVHVRQRARKPTPWSTARSARRCTRSSRPRAWSAWRTASWASATSPTASARSPRWRTSPA